MKTLRRSRPHFVELGLGVGEWRMIFGGGRLKGKLQRRNECSESMMALNRSQWHTKNSQGLVSSVHRLSSRYASCTSYLAVLLMFTLFELMMTLHIWHSIFSNHPISTRSQVIFALLGHERCTSAADISAVSADAQAIFFSFNLSQMKWMSIRDDFIGDDLSCRRRRQWCLRTYFCHRQ